MADCLNANESAITLRREHRLRDAREKLLVCAALKCPAEVRAECERRVNDVNAGIPTIVFEVKDEAGNDLSEVTVTMDGKPLARRLEGTAISLDPGRHDFRFESDGHAPVEKAFVLREAEKERRERIVLAAAPAEPSAPSAPSPPAPSVDSASRPAPAAAPRSTPESAAPSRARSTWLRDAGFVVGGAGVVGLGLGAVFGLLATSDKTNARCDANGYCDADALSAARSHATIATVGFVAGGALLATGVALVVFGPRGEAGSVQVRPVAGERSAGLLLGGSFQ